MENLLSEPLAEGISSWQRIWESIGGRFWYVTVVLPCFIIICLILVATIYNHSSTLERFMTIPCHLITIFLCPKQAARALFELIFY